MPSESTGPEKVLFGGALDFRRSDVDENQRVLISYWRCLVNPRFWAVAVDKRCGKDVSDKRAKKRILKNHHSRFWALLGPDVRAMYRKASARLEDDIKKIQNGRKPGGDNYKDVLKDYETLEAEYAAAMAANNIRNADALNVRFQNVWRRERTLCDDLVLYLGNFNKRVSRHLMGVAKQLGVKQLTVATLVYDESLRPNPRPREWDRGFPANSGRAKTWEEAKNQKPPGKAQEKEPVFYGGFPEVEWSQLPCISLDDLNLERLPYWQSKAEKNRREREAAGLQKGADEETLMEWHICVRESSGN